MAKHYVIDFQLSLINRSDNSGQDIHLSIETEISKKFAYEIHADIRHPSLEALKDKLEKKLSFAKAHNSKINISEYIERSYLFIDELQMTAHKL